MYELIFRPGTQQQERIAFSVSEGDLEDAIAFGRVDLDEPFENQMRHASYHKVMNLDVCDEIERIFGEPWIIMRNGNIIGRNSHAIDNSETDVA